jgi:hypothetical protein
METNRFTTLDVYLAAYLTLNGCAPDLEVQGGKVVFSFLQSQDIYLFLQQFNGNAPVAVADFTIAVKTLRGRMLEARRSS